MRPRRVVGSGPPRHGHRLLARRVREAVAERQQVEEVVRVQMADQDGVDVDVVTYAAQLREDAVATVEQKREVALLDEVAAAGAAGIAPGRGLSEHCYSHSFLSRRQLYPAVPV